MPDGDIVGGYGETFPARGTWIEIPEIVNAIVNGIGRSPQGERG